MPDIPDFNPENTEEAVALLADLFARGACRFLKDKRRSLPVEQRADISARIAPNPLDNSTESRPYVNSKSHEERRFFK